MMNLVSMTGRGTGSADGPIGRAEAELSSVNRKQLDVNLSLPRELAFAEADLVRLVQRRVARGHVGGELRVVRAEGAPACLKVDRAAARAYVGTLRALCAEIGERAPLVPALYRKRLEARFAEILPAGATADWSSDERLLKEVAIFADRADITEERIVREVALFVDRADVTEELVRLRSHLAAMGEALRGDGAAGRRLDFLAQEAGREINTIGSKANDAEMTRRVVAFKTELERVREQIQNIE